MEDKLNTNMLYNTVQTLEIKRPIIWTKRGLNSEVVLIPKRYGTQVRILWLSNNLKVVFFILKLSSFQCGLMHTSNARYLKKIVESDKPFGMFGVCLKYV